MSMDEAKFDKVIWNIQEESNLLVTIQHRIMLNGYEKFFETLGG